MLERPELNPNADPSLPPFAFDIEFRQRVDVRLELVVEQARLAIALRVRIDRLKADDLDDFAVRVVHHLVDGLEPMRQVLAA